MIKALLATTALVALTLPTHAVTLVQWDFQTPPADLTDSAVSPSVAASVGTGIANGLHASAATDWSTPAGNGSSDSLSSNTWATGDYYQFSFATTGFSGLLLSFDQTRSSTGPDSFKVAYSSNGGSTFTDFASYTVGAVTWNATTPQAGSVFTFDLSGVTALDSNPNVVLRLVSNVTPAAGGTNRIDNVVVTMTPVPEPGIAAMLLAGLAGVGFMARRRQA